MSQLSEPWTELKTDASYPYSTMAIAATSDMYLEDSCEPLPLLFISRRTYQLYNLVLDTIVLIVFTQALGAQGQCSSCFID